MSIFWPPSMWSSFLCLGNLPLYWSQLEVECISQTPWIPTYFQTLSNWQRPTLISTDAHHGPPCLKCYTKGRDRGQHLPEAEEVLAFDFRSPEDTYQGHESHDEARCPAPVAVTARCYPPVFCLNSHLLLLASLEMVSAHFLNLLSQAFG